MARALTAAAGGGAALGQIVATELGRPVASEVALLAERLAVRAAGSAVAVLFYGSALRDGALDGVLDFYVLIDRASAWPGSRVAAGVNVILPPHVGYVEEEIGGRLLRAKYAVMTLAQFRRGMHERSLDTTLWARFSQPCACAYRRSDADRAQVCAALEAAARTAAYWAAVLGPAEGRALDYWQALFGATYALELRLESSNRAVSIVSHAGPRYQALLTAAWEAADLRFTQAGEVLRPQLPPATRASALRRWRLRRRLGRPLNLLRLLKATLTFECGMDYVLWKVERHCGVRLDVAPWQRRFPLLAAPGLYWRLRRRGLLR